VAGSASAALPEFVGSYPTKYKFTSGAVEIPENGVLVVKCSAGSGEGSLTGAKTLVGKLAFTGCQTSSNEKCTTAGAGVGEIRSGELEDTLAYIKKTLPREAGVVFNYKKGTIWTFTCGFFQKGTIRGGIIAPVHPTDVLTKELGLSFRAEKGVQTPSEYENEKGEKVRIVPEMSLVSKETFFPTGLSVLSSAFNHFENSGKSVEIEVQI
jgi:hypothetical protein